MSHERSSDTFKSTPFVKPTVSQYQFNLIPIETDVLCICELSTLRSQGIEVIISVIVMFQSVLGQPAKSFIRLSGALKTRALQNSKHFTVFSCEILLKNLESHFALFLKLVVRIVKIVQRFYIQMEFWILFFDIDTSIFYFYNNENHYQKRQSYVRLPKKRKF